MFKCVRDHLDATKTSKIEAPYSKLNEMWFYAKVFTNKLDMF